MAMFRWVCTALIWAMSVPHLVRVLMLGRRPPLRPERPTSLGRWTVGALLTPIGCTVGLFSRAGGAPLWAIGTAIMLVGLLLTGLAFRKPRARA
ncbi:hypothetical protein [Kitasatospora griseola]